MGKDVEEGGDLGETWREGGEGEGSSGEGKPRGRDLHVFVND